MKTHRYLIVACVMFFLAGYVAKAQAGPPTNTVTLFWTPITNSPVPFVYEIQQSLVTSTNWTVLANVPSTQTTYTMNIDKDPMKFWKVRPINSTNSAWFGDFSNIVQPAWPGTIGTLGIRQGP